jgi:hypothetical protein
MDREQGLIDGLAQAISLIGSLQESMKNLTEACYLLKERIEALEAKREAVNG